MVIIWKDTPATYDTRRVTRVWFNKQAHTNIYYAVEGSNYVHHAKAKEIEEIVSDEAYAKLGRLS